jgi:hypothetical protein
MRIIASVLDRPTLERILDRLGEPTQPLAALTARSPPRSVPGDNSPSKASPCVTNLAVMQRMARRPRLRTASCRIHALPGLDPLARALWHGFLPRRSARYLAGSNCREGQAQVPHVVKNR